MTIKDQLIMHYKTNLDRMFLGNWRVENPDDDPHWWRWTDGDRRVAMRIPEGESLNQMNATFKEMRSYTLQADIDQVKEKQLQKDLDALKSAEANVPDDLLALLPDFTDPDFPMPPDEVHKPIELEP